MPSDVINVLQKHLSPDQQEEIAKGEKRIKDLEKEKKRINNEKKGLGLEINKA